MWVQAGFSPDTLWQQTPLHFQCAMDGVRKRLEGEREARRSQAYEAAVFYVLAKVNKLKSRSHYSERDGAPQSSREMLSMLQSMGANSNMKITRVKRQAVNDRG